MRMTRIIQTVLLALISSALAAPLWAGTYTAASCNWSDVNAVINGPVHTAVDGDVINVPSGTCTWTSTLAVSTGITIIGAGAGSTVILDNLTCCNSLFNLQMLTSVNQTVRLSGITFQPSPSLAKPPTSGSRQGTIANIGGYCSSTTCPHFRVDNLSISGWVIGRNFGGSFFFINDMFGVLDHNTLVASTSGMFTELENTAYLGVGANGDNDWAQPDTFGTDGLVYIENNTISDTDTTSYNDEFDATDTSGGGRFVVRFNNFTNVDVQTHGTESGGRERSGRHIEVYKNTFTCTRTSSVCWFVGLRGGTGMFMENTFLVPTGVGFNPSVNMSAFRVNDPFNPWGTCDGSSVYDTNDTMTPITGTVTGVSTSGIALTITDSSKSWTTNQWVNGGDSYSLRDLSISFASSYPWQNGAGWEITANGTNTLTAGAWGSKNQYTGNVGDSYQISRAHVCVDQPGRGQGIYVQDTSGSDNTPTPHSPVNQALDPVYVAGQIGTAAAGGWAEPNFVHKLVENRDYYQPQTSFDGSVGTGAGTLASRPGTCTPRVAYWASDQGAWNHSGSGGQGQLYICTAPNTWTLSYTPYTYPHPLISGTGSPAAPSNLVATPK